MDPADIGAEALGVAVDRIRSVERIPGGLTNESWLVRTEGEAVVVRISNADEQALQIARQSEARVLTAVAAAGIGPEIILNCPERHFLVTRYCPGHVWTLADARQPQNLRRIARVLSRLHSLPTPAGVQHTDLAAIVRGYWATLTERHPLATTDHARASAGHRSFEQAAAVGGAVNLEASALVGSEGQALLQQAAAMTAGLSAAGSCLCHNDVNHLNVIDLPAAPRTATSEGLCLLDWEYAGLGDPYFDLAGVCCYHSFDESLRNRLLRDYLAESRAGTLLRCAAGSAKGAPPDACGRAPPESDFATAVAKDAPAFADEDAGSLLRQQARLDAMCWLFAYIARLWAAVRETSGTVSSL